MNTHNLCCIGHITLDKIVTPKRTLHMPGGTSFYFAHGMSKLDTSDFLLVTALAVSEMDATGCGDTYMAGYLYMRNKGASYKEAGCFAAAMCTIKLEASGPFGGTEKDVWDIIERYK